MRSRSPRSPVRRRIIEVLAVGDHPVGELTDVIMEEFAVSRSAVSHHLRILRDHGAVIVAHDTLDVRLRSYRLDPAFLGRLDDAVAALFVCGTTGTVPPTSASRSGRWRRLASRGSIARAEQASVGGGRAAGPAAWGGSDHAG